MKKALSLLIALLACAALAVAAYAADYAPLTLTGLTDYWGESKVTVTFEAAKQETGSITATMDGTHFYTSENLHIITVKPGSRVTVSDSQLGDKTTAAGVVISGDHYEYTPPFYHIQVATGTVSDWLDGTVAHSPQGVDCPLAYIELNTGDFNYFVRLGAEEAAAPAPATEKLNVVPTSQRLTVNGAEKTAEIYNINDKNYFKLRDIAALLNGTSSQFSVDYDAATQTIAVTTGAPYTPNGSELVIGEDKSATCVLSRQSLKINGEAVALTAYNLGGNNFFGLRDLGAALGFNVDYDAETRTMIVTSK
ncbi:MAG: copper amine oxidase N-terminal domain-containing protein [Clostridiales bacterium]|nr:copper amine oxidase N-terminal domain-containing protein [Clostridiales bacterium]